MEAILRSLYQERASEPTTKGVLLIEKQPLEESLTDFFDAIILIVTDAAESRVKHYDCDGLNVALYMVREHELFYWMISGKNRKMIDWLFKGKVVFNRNEYITYLKKRLIEFPQEDRMKKVGIEFARLIRRFEDGKTLYYTRHYLDAFNHILHSLHHLARLAVIENGLYPEVTMWKQVKEVDPETYKLYDELIVGEEPIDKRLELLMIAIEFAIRSKIHIGKAHLYSVMSRKTNSWSFEELSKEQEVNEYLVDLEILLQYFTENDVMLKVVEFSKTPGIFHQRYIFKK
ncbi:nucleotidyltransferase-like protein [Alteribacillus sp. HJP-4]|uniref:nucleotidyltransferase-like protein n=1 Tax=Alteribacillus sp. HJP-4 TaxID=2775394 RepID=UPI0035CD0838